MPPTPPWLTPEPRIDQHVGDISEQVEEDVGRGGDQGDPLNYGVVAVEHAVDDQLAEAGDREDLLGQDRAGEQRAELERAERNNKGPRISHGVFEDDDGVGETPGSGSAP